MEQTTRSYVETQDEETLLNEKKGHEKKSTINRRNRQ